MHIIDGKDNTERIVSVEPNGTSCELFIQEKDGTIKSKVVDNFYWLLSSKYLDRDFIRLDGDLHYKYGKKYDTIEAYYNDKRRYKNQDVYGISDPREAFLVNFGYTYFKNLRIDEVSILSFDIETTSLNPKDKDAMVLIIANTIRKNGVITRKLFTYKDYSNQAELINAWCAYVREEDPSVICGHNIMMFDIPYLDVIANRNGTSLDLGRDGSSIKFNTYLSKFRKDGSQFYEYKKLKVYGRELIDTFFLSIKHDAVARKYLNYKLKNIIKQEGLEIPGRVFYDGDQIRHKYRDPLEWEKIKSYACFAPKSSLVTLDNGATKFMEDMSIGDAIIDCFGNTEYVYDKIERDYDGILYNFNVEGGRKILNVTGEHPFYVLNEKTLKYEWIKAQDLKMNHLLVRGEKKRSADALNYRTDLFWLFGMYQADGYVRLDNKKTGQKSLVITQHYNQVQPILNTLQTLKFKYSIVKKGKSKACDVVVINTTLADLFLKWSSGKFKAPEKKLSRECFNIMNNNSRLAKAFLAGLLDGDGHARKTKNQGESFQFYLGMTSPHMTNSVDLLSSSIGLNLTRQNFRTRGTGKINGYINGKPVRSKSTFYELTFFTESAIQLNPYLKIKQRTDLLSRTGSESYQKHVRIRKIEKNNYSGKVYNISTTGSHSYISNGLITHNCHDGDDALSLFDLMAPPLFYFTQSAPKTFQAMCETASGSQINALLVRSYLQNGHSIPKADEVIKFEGAISIGIPGVYRNVLSFDVSSLYPSVMLTYDVFPSYKDPNGHMREVLKYFTEQRLKDKKLAKETGDGYYQNLSDSRKIVINSIYGLLGATGLNFNSPADASLVTYHGRETLKTAIEWATGKGFSEWKTENNLDEAIDNDVIV